MNPTKLILKQGKTALLICDAQAKFAEWTFEFDKMIANTAKLINACRLLKIPMIVTEQNPKSLGPTVKEFDISDAKGPFSKTQLSMCIPEVKKELSKLCSGKCPEYVLLAGLAGNACIEMTAVDLRKDGIEVHAIADCISSRRQEETLLALNRMRDIGCVITTSENVMFKLLGDTEHEQFKNIMAIIK